MEEKQDSIFELFELMRDHILRQQVDLIVAGEEDDPPGGGAADDG